MNWQIDIVSIRRIDELLTDLDSEMLTDHSIWPATPASVSLDIMNLSYAYSPGKTVLKNIKMKLEGAGLYLLTGENGSGKTTLLEILLKLRRDFTGIIKLNGIDLKTIPSGQLRRLIAFVPQDEYTLSATIKENLLLGNKNVDQAYLKQTVDMLGLNKLLEEDKVITSENDLSLGQRQRVALGRAVLSNKPIIIMDEPTSSLDPLMEKDIRDYLQQLSFNKMIIIVSHNQQFKINAKKVFLLEQGELQCLQ